MAKKCKHCGVQLKETQKGLACNTCRIDLNRYNMTRTDMIKLLKDQKGKCKLCKKDVVLFNRRQTHSGYIDHDHNTGKVRGVLCHPCNTSLGYIENKLDLNKVKEYIGV